MVLHIWTHKELKLNKKGPKKPTQNRPRRPALVRQDAQLRGMHIKASVRFHFITLR